MFSCTELLKLFILIFLLLDATNDLLQTNGEISISVQSTECRPPPGITSEVKKLGLTADVQNMNNFEPRWVEVQPKYNCYGSRRHSIGKKNTEVKKEAPVVPSAGSGDSVIQSKDDLDLVQQSTIQRMAEFKDDTGVDFSAIADVLETSGTDAVLRMTKSPFMKRGNVFRRDESKKKANEVTAFVRGGMFGSQKGMSRSNSTGKLQALLKEEEKNNKLEPYPGSNTSSSSVVELSRELEQPKTLGHRRSSSLGSLNSIQIAGKSKENSEEKTKEEHGDHHTEHYKSKLGGDRGTPAKSVKNQLTNLGKQTVNWATTTKVRQNKREKHMFSPTSF